MRQRGVVAVIVAFLLVALAGFLGIAVDIGRLFVAKSELQNAADACALAAASQLNGTAGALTRAESAGIYAASRNRANLQSTTVTVTAADVAFSATLGPNNGYATQAGGAVEATARYVMCTTRINDIPMSVTSVLGIGAQNVVARAVATTAPAQSNCAVPLGMCKLPASPSGNPLQGISVGQWITSRLSASATGSFDWIDFTPPAGGATELADLLAGQGQCNMPAAGTSVGEQGNKNSLGKAWNTRFGLYKGPYNKTDSPPHVPDFTGFAYTPVSWPSQFNAYSGTQGATPNYLAARTQHLPYQGNVAAFGSSGSGIGGGYTNSTQSELTSTGGDRRLVVVPVVDCGAGGWGGAHPQTVPVLAYACVLLLHPMTRDNGPGGGEDVWVEFRGAASDITSPCVTSGLAGGTAGPLVPVLVQ